MFLPILVNGICLCYNTSQMLSIVIPVHNAWEHLRELLISIDNNTYYPFEIILIDDASKKDIRKFIDGIVLVRKDCRLIKIRNKTQKWINYNWNLGAKIAQGEYVAFLNSDIVVPRGWDLKLSRVLAKKSCACPFEKKRGGEVFDIPAFYKSKFPHMIKGSCFMLKKEDLDKIFPIPDKIKHWCGDNWIADRVAELKGVGFAKCVKITHQVEASARTLPIRKYANRIYKDILAYQKLSGKDMSWSLDSVFRRYAAFLE